MFRTRSAPPFSARRSLWLGITMTATLIVIACGGGGSPAAPAAVMSFQGVWEGTWVRTGCSETGGASGIACSQPQSQSGTLRLTLTQTETTVQGNVEIGAFAVPAAGSASGGTLTLSGQTHLSQPNATAHISNWNTTRSGNSMSGNFTFTLVADDPTFGSQTLQVSLQNVNKTS